ncbi:MAG: hypothetical protein ACR2GH_18785 [Pseudonocardia sp.]
MSLPRAQRGQRARAGVRLHILERPPGPSEVQVVHGLPATTPARSILDSSKAGAQPEQVELAAQQALQRGLVTPRRLRAAAEDRSDRIRRFVEQVLSRAGG